MQIVSLGAGFDTLFFRLLQQSRRNLSFVEVDCQGIVDAKKDIVVDDSNFTALFTVDGRQVPAARPTATDAAKTIALRCEVEKLQSTYSLVACDLGDVVRLEASLDAAGVDRSLPTLVIAECVVVRMDT